MHQSSSDIHMDHDDYSGVYRLQTMVDIMGARQEDVYEPPNPSV